MAVEMRAFCLQPLPPRISGRPWRPPAHHRVVPRTPPCGREPRCSSIRLSWN